MMHEDEYNDYDENAEKEELQDEGGYKNKRKKNSRKEQEEKGKKNTRRKGKGNKMKQVKNSRTRK